MPTLRKYPNEFNEQLVKCGGRSPSAIHLLSKRASSARSRSLMLVALLLTAAPALRSDLKAQERTVGAELWGRVVQAGDTTGLPGALVEVVGLSVSTTASRTGFYRLAGLRPGPQMLRVRMLGYQAVTMAVELREGRAEHKEISLERLPTVLTEVRIEGELRKVPPRFEEVYRRMATANGKFFTREDIERLNPPDVQALLMQVVTVRVSDQGIQFARCEQGGAYALSGGGATGVQIYIDGRRMTGRLGSGSNSNEHREILRMVTPSQIQAIEIYGGVSRIPGEFLDNACAVISIWTRSY